MPINVLGGLGWSQYASQVMQKRNTGNESSTFAQEDSGTDSAKILSGDKNLTPQPGATSYDFHSITNDQMWDLAGKAGLNSLRMFSITHPPQVSVDGKPNDSSTANRKLDFSSCSPA